VAFEPLQRPEASFKAERRTRNRQRNAPEKSVR
jgi:hypothetical protein